MSVFWYEYLVHTNGRSVLHWIYKVVVRKYEKNCWYQIIKSISIYYTLSYRPLQMLEETLGNHVCHGGHHGTIGLMEHVGDAGE